MQLHELKPTPGARNKKYRAARGMAQGRGKQAGRGQSGQKKRNTVAPGFEGGQNPWFRRLPKRGFTNYTHVEYQVVNLANLENTFKEGDKVDFASLSKAKLIRRKIPVKLLGNGKLTKKLNITVDGASQSAIEAVKKAGGEVNFTK